MLVASGYIKLKQLREENSNGCSVYFENLTI